MTGVSSNKSLRKALGSIKDTTTIGLAKVNSDYKNLDIAIVKATNHVERPAKEKHIKVIFGAISAVRPRADVAYCIHALARRLSKTRNWAVALKTLIVIHRALREVDRSFREELVNYGRSRSRMLNLAHFKDDSSPDAWGYSAWIRVYALYLEERLECFRVLKYDVKTGQSGIKDLDTADLLTHLPTLQQLLRRVLGCQPEGAAVHNYVIQLALSMVTSESMNIYSSINDGIVNLVDKFFQMPHQNAITALGVYRKAREQAERLSELYELCKTIDICRRERFIRIEQPPVSIIQAMEEYVRDAARVSTYLKEQVKPVIEERKEVLAIEDKKVNEPDQKGVLSPPDQVLEEKVVAQPTDLLGLDEPKPITADTDEMNVLALTFVPIEQPKATTPTPNPENGATGWELSLVTTPTPSSKEPITAATKLGGGLDMLILDSLYDDAVRRSSNHNINYSQQQPAGSQPNPWIKQAVSAYDPFSASPAVSAMTDQQHQAYVWQQQQMMMKGQQQHPQKELLNRFGYPNTYGSVANGGERKIIFFFCNEVESKVIGEHRKITIYFFSNEVESRVIGGAFGAE